MPRTLDQVLSDLPAERRERIDARHAELVAEVEALAELRRALGPSQGAVGRALGVSQPAVSKIERSRDLNLATLRDYVAALGGEVEVVVRLPGRAPVLIRSLGTEGNR